MAVVGDFTDAGTDEPKPDWMLIAFIIAFALVCICVLVQQWLLHVRQSSGQTLQTKPHVAVANAAYNGQSFMPQYDQVGPVPPGQDYAAVEPVGPNPDGGKQYLDPAPDPGAAGGGVDYITPAAVATGDSVYFDPAQTPGATYFDPAAIPAVLGTAANHAPNAMYQAPPELSSNAGIYQEVHVFNPANTGTGRGSGPVHHVSPVPLYLADGGGQTNREGLGLPSDSTLSEGLYADADEIGAGAPTHFYPGKD